VQFEDVEALAQPKGALLRGMRYRTIYYFLTEKSAWGAWLTISFLVSTRSMFTDQDFVVLSTTGHEIRQRRCFNKIGN
jgi:hypothetical protein